MEALVAQQQVLVRALRTFVDALRDIKHEEQAYASIDAAARALCESVQQSADPIAAIGDDKSDQVWRTGLVPALQQLSACMEHIDQLEVRASRLRAFVYSCKRPSLSALVRVDTRTESARSCSTTCQDQAWRSTCSAAWTAQSPRLLGAASRARGLVLMGSAPARGARHSAAARQAPTDAHA